MMLILVHSGFAFDRSTFQRRASRDFGHRNRTTMGESSTPANILQLFAGTGLMGGHVAGEESAMPVAILRHLDNWLAIKCLLTTFNT